MSSLNQLSRFIFRPLAPTRSEIMSFAALYANAYRRQFFDPAGPLEGALGKEFPVLEKYEDIFCFWETSKKIAANLGERETDAYAFVAAERIANTAQLVGLVKGGSWRAGDDMGQAIAKRTDADAGKVAELGSIYVAPAYQGKGIGRALVELVACSALEKGFTGLITRAYAKNISPRFFIGKTGAKAMGSCRIPYGYTTDLLAAKGLSRKEMPDALPGLWFYWDEKALAALVKPAPMRDKSIPYGASKTQSENTLTF